MIAAMKAEMANLFLTENNAEMLKKALESPSSKPAQKTRKGAQGTGRSARSRRLPTAAAAPAVTVASSPKAQPRAQPAWANAKPGECAACFGRHVRHTCDKSQRVVSAQNKQLRQQIRPEPRQPPKQGAKPRGSERASARAPGVHRCDYPSCGKEFGSLSALSTHQGWHKRGDGSSALNGGQGYSRNRAGGGAKELHSKKLKTEEKAAADGGLSCPCQPRPSARPLI